MNNHTSDQNDEVWRSALHEIKGAADNLGFEEVAETSKTYEMTTQLSQKEKETALEEIQATISDIRTASLDILAA